MSNGPPTQGREAICQCGHGARTHKHYPAIGYEGPCSACPCDGLVLTAAYPQQTEGDERECAKARSLAQYAPNERDAIELGWNEGWDAAKSSPRAENVERERDNAILNEDTLIKQLEAAQADKDRLQRECDVWRWRAERAGVGIMWRGGEAG